MKYFLYYGTESTKLFFPCSVLNRANYQNLCMFQCLPYTCSVDVLISPWLWLRDLTDSVSMLPPLLVHHEITVFLFYLKYFHQALESKH